ncbi:site-specific tyrosine recombinase XerC [Corynebacterium atrinae]|uniref:site-specific integrase n=1 Tax=Corynebacterium atrinae TaxID=1336740 RepID=UPI0025B35AA6|nr:site-specific integrase [Corynebacterium atrinae]WJY62136.1 site-specific tyrosine recombinase XerC [Corynebacterium atrinae]
MRDVEANGATKPKAERALKARVKERVGERDSKLGGDTRLRTLANRWWETIERRVVDGDLNQDTRREYIRYRDYVVEACGELAIRECTVDRLERAVLTKAGSRKRVRAEMKRTLTSMFSYAIRLGAVDHNPAANIDVGRDERDPTRALTLDELTEMRRRIHEYETTGGPRAKRASGAGAGGRPRAVYLMDVFDLQLALGCRIGELLALQWEDVADLEGNSPTVTINATLKWRSKAEGQRLGLPGGLYRQDKPKTEAGRRVVVIPAFAVVILRRLKSERVPGVPWIIATSEGTPRQPANVNTALRKARGPEFEWVTFHSLRRTNGTHITATTGNSLAAAKVLGHSNTRITEAAYTDWRHVNSDVSDVVQGLAPKVTYLNENVG